MSNRTEAQREASRRNGSKSRGPVTAEGKARSSRKNPQPSIDLEQERFTQSFINDLHPETDLELRIASNLADNTWRLQRLQAAESEALNIQLKKYTRRADPDPIRIAKLWIDHPEAVAPLTSLGRYAGRYERTCLRHFTNLRNMQRDRIQQQQQQALIDLEGAPRDITVKWVMPEDKPEDNSWQQNLPELTRQMIAENELRHETPRNLPAPTTGADPRQMRLMFPFDSDYFPGPKDYKNKRPIGPDGLPEPDPDNEPDNEPGDDPGDAPGAGPTVEPAAESCTDVKLPPNQQTPSYNQGVRQRSSALFALLAAAFVCLALAISACSGPAQNKEAIRKGIVEHLSKRQDMLMSSMDVEVVSVNFRENEADAVVSFKPKGATTGGMDMPYTLEKKDNKWVVKPRPASQQGGHGAMPPAMGGEGMANPHGATPPTGELPAGHPAVKSPEPEKKQ